MKILKNLLPLFLCFALFACKSKKEDETIVPLKESYDKGIDFLEKSKYDDAAEEFGKVFMQQPGDDQTPQAELMQAYSLFLAGRYDDASDVLDIFITLHPLNSDIAYAYYLKALSNYVQIGQPDLDQTRTGTAKDCFEEIIKRFPDSKYAIDSSLKIDLVNDHLAGYEMYIGRYYEDRKDPIAAINRFKKVVVDYPTSSHIQEALYRLTEAYSSLGLKEEAKKYASILGHNYPDSSWYKKAYALVMQDSKDAKE